MESGRRPPTWPSILPLLPSTSLCLCPTIFALCGLSCLLRPYLRAAVSIPARGGVGIFCLSPSVFFCALQRTAHRFTLCPLRLSYCFLVRLTTCPLRSNCGLISQCVRGSPLNLSFSNPSRVFSLHSTTTVLSS